MLDVAGIMLVLGSTVDKAKKFDWTRLIPKFKVDKYQYAGAGIDLTWRVGPGIGVGLGVIDIWFGWPRLEENLHFKGCLHDTNVEDAVVVS